MPEGAHYRFEPLQRRGLVLGLGLGQLAVIGSAVVTALALVKTWPGMTGLAAAVAVLGAGGLLCRPVSGRTPLRWMGTAASFGARRRSATAPVPGSDPGLVPVGSVAAPVAVALGAPVAAAPARRLPAQLLVPGLQLSEVPPGDGGGAIGALVDERAGTVAAIVRAQGGAFCLLDEADKEGKLGAWAAVLESLSGPRSPLVRLQWCQRALPADSHALISHLQRTGQPGSPGYAGHLALLEKAGPRSRRHEVLLVVTVRCRSRRGRPSPEGATVLRNEVRALRAQMGNVGLVCQGVLDSRGAGAALGGFLLPDLARHPGAHPWPLAVEEHWADVHADLSWHRTYWVAEWPRSRVGPDFLSPLLVGTARRSFSVVMAPVPAERAVRDAESSRTAQMADAQLRAQGGFLETAQHRRRAEALAGRETELADGRGVFELAGYVSVSADDKPGLEQACAELERAAGAAKLCLRPLFGQQKEALTWALPFGRGL